MVSKISLCSLVSQNENVGLINDNFQSEVKTEIYWPVGQAYFRSITSYENMDLDD